jgi:hypothetical protein
LEYHRHRERSRADRFQDIYSANATANSAPDDLEILDAVKEKLHASDG